MSKDDSGAGAVVVDTSRSPSARLRPVPVGAVRLSDAFWEPRRRTNREVTIPSQHERCEKTGCIDNFRRAAGKEVPAFKGMRFGDTDAYKWLEAASWSLGSAPDPELERAVDEVTAEVAAAQQDDGYLNTRFTFEKAKDRWTNLPHMHELYCAGHLFQAAVAHCRATGKDSLLGIARRFADHICDVFGPEEEGKRQGTGGHPEVEMGLVELYRATGDSKYLEQAQYFVDARGRKLAGGDEYHQDHAPVREFSRMYGHAVRAGYLNAGIADVVAETGAETGDEGLRAALERMWENMTTTQTYVTGGVGSRHAGEAFGRDYELPNERAYTETCAGIAVVMWAWRMLALSGGALYADVMEHALVNAVLPGLSLDGKEYFYENPLADDGTHRRKGWFGCACCPPNVARLLASLPGYFYSTTGDGVWLHMYAEGKAALRLPGGREFVVAQRTRYPWDGEVEIEVEDAGEGEGEIALMLRIPAWCEEGAAVEVNGAALEDEVASGSYAEVRRAWKAGDTVRLTLPMPPRRIECHPYVAENAGRVALARGPVVYCVEAVDNPGVDLRDLVLPGDAKVSEERRGDLLGGVTVLRAPARVVPPDEGWAGKLYRSARPEGEAPEGREVELVDQDRAAPSEPPNLPFRPAEGEAGSRRSRRTVVTELVAVPYYAWANREPGRMQVWLRSG